MHILTLGAGKRKQDSAPHKTLWQAAPLPLYCEASTRAGPGPKQVIDGPPWLPLSQLLSHLHHPDSPTLEFRELTPSPPYSPTSASRENTHKKNSKHGHRMSRPATPAPPAAPRTTPWRLGCPTDEWASGWVCSGTQVERAPLIPSHPLQRFFHPLHPSPLPSASTPPPNLAAAGSKISGPRACSRPHS